jgi:hypothetical protein
MSVTIARPALSGEKFLFDDAAEKLRAGRLTVVETRYPGTDDENLKEKTFIDVGTFKSKTYNNDGTCTLTFAPGTLRHFSITIKDPSLLGAWWDVQSTMVIQPQAKKGSGIKEYFFMTENEQHAELRKIEVMWRNWNKSALYDPLLIVWNSSRLVGQ